MDTAQTLIDRGKTHGAFEEVAATAQRLKTVMANGKNWKRLHDGQRQALEMIAFKVARILAGDANYVDHWRDVAGYAQLVVTALEADEGCALQTNGGATATEQTVSALRVLGAGI